MNFARNWKWMLPAAGTCLMAVFALVFNEYAKDYLPVSVLFGCGVGNVGVAFILLISAWANFRNYFRWEETDQFTARQHALNETTAVLLSENFRQMHPEAIKLFAKFGVKTVWEIKMHSKEDREWILQGANVHFGFIEYVLDHSNSITLMQKRLLSEGSYQWDPDGLLTDYEQYDAFLAWLISRMMVTRAFGNMSAQWIPPWKPELVKEWMGLADEVPEELETGKKEKL